jgi:parvulin-like peptidyl-prolyl isomerase
MAAAMLLLALAGCRQLEKLQELGLGKSKVDPLVPAPPLRKSVADQANAAKPAGAPVKLDGSAQTEGSRALPNAPTIGGGSGTEALSAIGNSSRDGGAPAGAGAAETGDNAGAGTAATAGPDDLGWDETERPAGPNQIVQTRGQRDEDDGNAQAAENPGADVIPQIEIEGTGAQLKRGQVAAMVNGVPIFAEDVLRTMPLEIQKALEQNEQAAAAGLAPAEKVRQYRQQMIEQFLQQHIQQELLLQALKAKFKAEVLTGFQKQLDAQFDAEVLPKLLKDKGYASAVELERELEKQGSSIEILRSMNRNRQLAQQYMGMQMKAHDAIDVPEIREYYQKHREDYAIVAKAKWEEIQLQFSRHGGKEKTRKLAEEILTRLDDGDVFAVVAKECSDGPTKSSGGLWRWTTQGSIKSKEIDKALFEQPVGKIGVPIETADGIEIIRVIDRSDAGYERFEDVQDDIRNHLKTAQFQRRVNELLKELTENATIEKFTDRL